MVHRISLLFRPFGIAFGLLILLNLALSLQGPELSATRIWLDVDLPEPWLSLFAAILGLALLVPHKFGQVSWLRWLVGGVICGFSVLSLGHTATFYLRFYQGRCATDFPAPLSLLVFTVLSFESIRVLSWRPAVHRFPPPARVFFRVISVIGSLFLITLLYIVTFGRTDFRCQADAAIIFGAKVYRDGRPCAALIDRLETGIDLYEKGYVRHLIMTGAVEPNGQSEPGVMKEFARRRGVPIARIIVDTSGYNTKASAVSCARIAREHGFQRILAVTQYFHCARVKLIFDREGVPCRTVPTCSLQRDSDSRSYTLSREPFFLLREAVAFPFYLVYHR